MVMSISVNKHDVIRTRTFRECDECNLDDATPNAHRNLVYKDDGAPALGKSSYINSYSVIKYTRTRIFVVRMTLTKGRW